MPHCRLIWYAASLPNLLSISSAISLLVKASKLSAKSLEKRSISLTALEQAQSRRAVQPTIRLSRIHDSQGARRESVWKECHALSHIVLHATDSSFDVTSQATLYAVHKNDAGYFGFLVEVV